MPLGCIVCTALIVSRPLVYPYANGNFGHIEVVSIYLQRGASLVARSDLQGNAKTSMCGASDSAGLHAFFLSLEELFSRMPIRFS